MTEQPNGFILFERTSPSVESSRHILPELPDRPNLGMCYVPRAEVDSENSIRLALEVDSLGRPILDEYCSKFF